MCENIDIIGIPPPPPIEVWIRLQLRGFGFLNIFEDILTPPPPQIEVWIRHWFQLKVYALPMPDFFCVLVF